MSKLADPADIVAATGGRTQPAAQYRALQKLGIPCQFVANQASKRKGCKAKLLVSAATLEAWLNKDKPVATGAEPNWDAVD